MSKCANNKMTTKGQERKISKEKKKKNEDKPKRTGGTNQEHKEHTRSTGVQGRSQMNQQRGEGNNTA